MIDIVVLFPCGGRISSVQERQMTTVAAVEKNVHCVGVEGTLVDTREPPALTCRSVYTRFSMQYTCK